VEPVEEGTYFVRDDDGRALILRGMNIMSSAKGDPERLPDLEEEDVERYARQWGFNPAWPGADQFMRELLDMGDRMMLGWTYWSYDPGGWGIWERDDQGEFVERENANALVRPYPQRVAGIPRSFSYDPDTRTFALSFDPSPSATLPTEIYVPETRHYPDGWSLSGCSESQSCSWTWDANLEILRVLTPNQAARVELTITPDG
jgi:endoglycosylceramidase